MSKAAIEKRLGSYWKMEAANVLLLPLGTLYLASALDWQLGLASIAAFVPCCALLAIGAQYWRAKLIQLREGGAFPQTIGLLAALEWPTLALTVAGLGVVIACWLVPGLAASRADLWTGTIVGILAALEYVNYYHRQVQHFDHASDFKRLLGGGGFRRSQMAVDIARWRAAIG